MGCEYYDMKYTVYAIKHAHGFISFCFDNDKSLGWIHDWHSLSEVMLNFRYIPIHNTYRKTSNISRTSDGNKIVDHSDVVGASPVGAAPTTSSFLTQHLGPLLLTWFNFNPSMDN